MEQHQSTAMDSTVWSQPLTFDGTALIREDTASCRAPNSFAFFANEWVTAPSPRSKLLGRASSLFPVTTADSFPHDALAWFGQTGGGHSYGVNESHRDISTAISWAVAFGAGAGGRLGGIYYFNSDEEASHGRSTTTPS